MLLREYGISPEVFDSENYDSSDVCCLALQPIFRELKSQGVVRGICLKQFREKILEILERSAGAGMSIEVRDKLKYILKRRVVRSDEATNYFQSWVQNIGYSDQQHTLYGKIISELETEPGIEDFATPLTLNNYSWWDDGRVSSQTIQASFAEMSGALGNILRLSSELIFVDPFLDFRPKENYQGLLRLIRETAKINPDCRLKFWKCIRNTRYKDYSENSLIEVFASLGKGRTKFKHPVEVVVAKDVHRWEKSSAHNRYLLSNLICLSNNLGFEDKNSELADYSVLAKESEEIVRNNFEGNLSGHENLLKLWFRKGLERKEGEFRNFCA